MNAPNVVVIDEVERVQSLPYNTKLSCIWRGRIGVARAFQPSARVVEDIGTGVFEMGLVLDQFVVERSLPEMDVVGGPACASHAGAPGFLDPGFEVADEVGDGWADFPVWVGAEDDDGVKVIGHDDVSVYRHAKIRRIEPDERLLHKFSGIVQENTGGRDGAE